MNIKKLLEQKIVVLFVPIILGIILGFYFKTFSDEVVIYRDHFKGFPETKEKVYLNKIKEYYPFFTLTSEKGSTHHRDGKFDFNWFAFTTGTILIYLILITNKYINIRKIYYPYLKEKYK